MAPEWSGASFIASTGWLRWSKTSVGALIENPYGLKLPVRTMGEYLKRWGFTPQKPLRKAFEQKPKMVRAWLAETYPLIAAGAKAEGAEIFWGDRTGVNNQPNRSRGYAPRGQTPVVSQTSKRFGFSVMSAVTNKGGARWMVYPGALDSDRLIEFLTRLIKQAGGRKVYLILDNLRVHHRAPVKTWLAQHTKGIAMDHLPSYSPELNPEKHGYATAVWTLAYAPELNPVEYLWTPQGTPNRQLLVTHGWELGLHAHRRPAPDAPPPPDHPRLLAQAELCL